MKISATKLSEAAQAALDLDAANRDSVARVAAAVTESAPTCDCIFSCADDPETQCGLSGTWHVHPEWPCEMHPDAPGDRTPPVTE